MRSGILSHDSNVKRGRGRPKFVDAGPTGYPAREREDLVQLGFFKTLCLHRLNITTTTTTTTTTTKPLSPKQVGVA